MEMEQQARRVSLPPAVAWVCEHCTRPFTILMDCDREAPAPRLFLQLIKLAHTFRGRIGYELREDARAHGRVTLASEGREDEVVPPGAVDREIEDLIEPLFLAGTGGESLHGLFTKAAFKSRVLENLNIVSRYMLTNQDIEMLQYTFLTGMTAGYGLGYNRAVLFNHDVVGGTLCGEKAIGSLTLEEARHIWEIIETEDQNIEDFILRYKKEGFFLDSSLLGAIEESAVRLSRLAPQNEFRLGLERGGVGVFHAPAVDPVLQRFNPGGEFILAPIRTHQRLWGFVFADNAFNGRPLDTEILSMTELFVNQTAFIWENLFMIQNLRKEARLDYLTGVANRNEMENILDYLFSIEKPDLRFWLLLMDIDHFKSINDEKGHAYGDRILVEYSRLLKTVVRDRDFVARYGGDEFMIIIRDVGRDKVREIAERLRFETKERLKETVSIGVAAYPSDSRSRIELFEKADIALYKAKNNGRDRVVFYEEN